MRKTLACSTAVLILLLSVWTATPAHADHERWVIGSGFRIGHFHLNLVFRDFDRHRRPVYYYRVHERFPYRNFPCTSRCFTEGGYYYHEANCPGVQRHFDAYHQDRHDAFVRFAPRPRSPYFAYRGDGRYNDRHDDRYRDRDDYYYDDDRDRDRRHHRRPRHQHPSYCPYHH